MTEISEAAKKAQMQITMDMMENRFDGIGYFIQEAIDAATGETKNELDLANGCLEMIKEWCEANGEDMSATPAIMYPEAINCVLRKQLAEKDAEIERLRADNERLLEAMKSHKTRVYCSHGHVFSESCIGTCPEYLICHALE